MPVECGGLQLGSAMGTVIAKLENPTTGLGGVGRSVGVGMGLIPGLELQEGGAEE